MEETLRELYPSEGEILEERLRTESSFSPSGTLKWALLWFAALVALLLLCSFIFNKLSSLDSEGLAPILVAVLMVLGFFCFYFFLASVISLVSDYRSYRRFVRQIRPQIEATLTTKQVLSKRVFASSLIKIEQLEDEGSLYLFELSGAKTLFLWNYDDFEDESHQPWPSTEFEFVFSAVGELWITLVAAGQSLKPQKVLEMDETFMEYTCLDDLQVLEGKPEVVIERWRDSA